MEELDHDAHDLGHNEDVRADVDSADIDGPVRPVSSPNPVVITLRRLGRNETNLRLGYLRDAVLRVVGFLLVKHFRSPCVLLRRHVGVLGWRRLQVAATPHHLAAGEGTSVRRSIAEVVVLGATSSSALS